jgi:hypothetical protein
VSDNIIGAYVTATNRLPDYFEEIRKGTAPSKFTVDHLEKLGFKSKADRAIINLLKGLGFLDESNAPTSIYRSYLDEARSREILGRQVRSAYDGLFEINRQAQTMSPAELKGKFRSILNVSDQVAGWMATTFLKLCSISEFESAGPVKPKEPDREPKSKQKAPPIAEEPGVNRERLNAPEPLSLVYRFEIHLPNTTDVDVYRAIFKALREHLRD